MKTSYLKTAIAVTVLVAAGFSVRAQDAKPESRKDPQETLRRLTLDVAGREPTQKELKDFDSDSSAEAYRRAVDRLVAEATDKKARDELDKEAVRLRLTNQYRDLLAAAENQWRSVEENKTYLGVGVEAPGDALRSQLELAEGVGLVVNYVDPNGPSKDLIHQHDVLEKLDDQLLINGDQFATLVRMHKQGSTVTVSLVREAKPVRIAVKLGQKEASSKDPAPPGGDEKVILTGSAFKFDPAADWSTALTGSTLTYTRNGPTTFDDGSLIAVFQPAAGQNYLTAFDRTTGTLIYSGPADNTQQLDQLPEPLRNKLAIWRTYNGKVDVSGIAILQKLPIVGRLYENSASATAPATQPAPSR